MSSLWTPDGEHEVPPAGSPGPAGAAGGTDDAGGGDPSAETLRAAAAAIGVDLDSLDDQERAELAAELEQMMQVRREVANTPAAEMLTNHMMRLFDLTTIYLEGDPPAFAEAATVIEAFRAMLEALGGRLGESEEVLTEALGQLQMLFVRVKDATEGAGSGSA
jgi:hypothetical protein